MKLGVSSYSFEKYRKKTGCNYIDMCRMAKEAGFDAIEFTDLLPDVSGTDELSAAKAIREECEKLGLSISAYTIGANFLSDDQDKEAERIMRKVDTASALGCPVMRHDACYGPRKDRFHYTWRSAIEDMAPYIRRVTEYAAGLGIRTCTENHGFFMQDSERVEQLILAVDHPNYGWLVDIGNFLCADEDPVSAVGRAAPYAFHVHAKDFLIKKWNEPDPGQGWFMTRGGDHIRGTIVGNGAVPVKACLDILKKNGYSDTVSLEFEGLEDNLFALEAGLDYLKRIL